MVPELVCLVLSVISALFMFERHAPRTPRAAKDVETPLTPAQVHALEIECEIIPADAPPPALTAGEASNIAPLILYSARKPDELVPPDTNIIELKNAQGAIIAYGYECGKCNSWWTGRSRTDVYNSSCRGAHAAPEIKTVGGRK